MSPVRSPGAVEVHGITASYADTRVLTDVDLVVPAGTTTAVLGGSGSGKTTLLRVVAGFLRPDSGEVRIGDATVVGPGTWVAPEKRGIGYVRQDGGLFPHLDVAGNIAFGLPFPRRRHRGRVLELLDLVGLDASLADRTPDQLSGGQQQRVALARALALEPDVVLLDEPFSALDTALRESTREATGRALREAGATAVLVTHDQEEALSFADEVAILREGRFSQVAPPREVYGAPVDAHVAGFLGDAVLLPGDADAATVHCALGTIAVEGAHPTGAVQVMLRPEQIIVVPAADSTLLAKVASTTYYGHDAMLDLLVTGDDTAYGSVEVRSRVVGTSVPNAGDVVGLRVTGGARAFALTS
ncbi:ABC transporter ATP-binding protein [Luteipulveratus halotolerans]|uniref:ABC-type quaternary amine transporter n=1 Tax=Luteipulveratus halotolerans TaxID=1631356 RepID=A0A0L6CIN4_9MICO|nr:ABC transporter ATP-binding protein [Luteipulveratus halotolerans]KNX37662.1 sugar ABC transporter [Luteipulveratus halotolerans]